jgi:C_GCAxxG_C_C family probable redox protein
MKNIKCGIFTDTFPPNIGGVSTVALNYAKIIQNLGGTSIVAAPWYPEANDSKEFKVYRYISANISKQLGYRVGNPFNPRLIQRIIKENLDIIHVHSPFTSALLARVIKQYTGVPIVLTYHSKFDVDIEKRISLESLRHISIQFMLNNVNAFDEVWVVSHGAGENLRSLGYTGPVVLMENGTDFKKDPIPQEDISKIEAIYGLAPDDIVFLFVGRMMWYKNLKLVIDGLQRAKALGAKFQMIFIGDGMDMEDIKAYVEDAQIMDLCHFSGNVEDRELLKAHYGRANLFVFPSTYDTNGIVVREAAACGCPSVLVSGSCAAEGILHDETGLLIDETSDSLAQVLLNATQNSEKVKRIGQNASERIYISWEDAVQKAYDRYGLLCSRKVVRRRNSFYQKYRLFKRSGYKDFKVLKKCDEGGGSMLMEEAIRKYREQEYDLSCSEATLHAANAVYGLELDDKSLRMMAGFSGGLMTEDLCGVIAGSVAVLSVLLTNDVAHQSPVLKEAVKTYLEKVDTHFGSRICSQIKKTHRDLKKDSCNPVIFENAKLLDEVVQQYQVNDGRF